MLSPPLEKFLLIQNFINGGAGVCFGNALLSLRSFHLVKVTNRLLLWQSLALSQIRRGRRLTITIYASTFPKDTR